MSKVISREIVSRYIEEYYKKESNCEVIGIASSAGEATALMKAGMAIIMMAVKTMERPTERVSSSFLARQAAATAMAAEVPRCRERRCLRCQKTRASPTSVSQRYLATRTRWRRMSFRSILLGRRTSSTQAPPSTFFQPLRLWIPHGVGSSLTLSPPTRRTGR